MQAFLGGFVQNREKLSIFSIWAMLLIAATLPAIREEMEFRLISSISPEEAMQWPSESVMKTACRWY